MAPAVWMKSRTLLNHQREALYSRWNLKTLYIAEKERKKEGAQYATQSMEVKDLTFL